ncbi:MAG: 50S ribosomal protein L18 [Planctomycetaceae bacterium]
MAVQKTLAKQRQRRVYRVRNQVRGAGRPRLSVFRSGRHMYAQIIDDSAGRTLVSASTAEKTFTAPKTSTVEAATAIGKLIGERAVNAGIKQVAFDRGPYRYHGRVAALAEGARQSGLDF